MVARKRGRDEMEAEEPVEEPSMLHKLRNMWQFANLAQYLHLFIGALKIDHDFDIEDLETECLKPQPSEKLAEIGLALLKHVSSHKGLTPDIFDEYARRQFVAKAPSRNPFGTEETPNKFDDFDVFTKIRVLQQLSVWTLNNPNTIRERLNPTEAEQVLWRIEDYGWDAQDRTLILLDDLRLYRRTDPAPPTPPPKAKSKSKAKKSRSTRNSKRWKQATPEPDEPAEDDEVAEVQETKEEDDGLGGMKWECMCVTLEDYQDYMSSIRKSRDANEKALYKRIEEEILPELAKVAEEQAKKEARRMKELEVLQKLATAKRSSRISARMEKQKEVEEAEEAERKRQAELAKARAEQDRQRKLEEAHESRRMTREQRLRERETAKILKEEEVRKMEEDQEKIEAKQARLSERHLKTQMKKRQEELRRLNEEDYWVFDCEKCGLHGECLVLKDGTAQVACDKCGVWQHSRCHGLPDNVPEDFPFICSSCKRKADVANQPKLPPLKLRLTSSSPSTNNGAQVNGRTLAGPARQLEAVRIPVQKPYVAQSPPRPAQPPPFMTGPSLSPRGQALGPPGIQRSEAAYGSPFTHATSSSPPTVPRPYASNAHNGVSMANGFPTSSSPPQYQGPRAPISPFNNYNLSFPRQNGSPYNAPNPFQAPQHPPYGSSFSRPTSSAGPAGPYQSPIKHSPAPSPRPTNGVPNAYNFNSPHSSFPPNVVPGPVFSPTKNSSPPPPAQQMSSPAPAPVKFAPSPRQMPAQVLPDPIPAPSKHDAARPISSHSMADTPVLPPIKPLPPSANPQNLSPPTKKPSPTPEKPSVASAVGNGIGSSQQ
ncbi:hypothetical protein BU26DRAFT_498484 [Trematosphaeria pertusa]|uniref:Zinc finger PHD-type domain-containing protein n=1 Tax=Trematosphaeria pertusa TaxID=390896 RepID=A0A6A6IZB2_9PLEO|nr:uncharacterized protein BU26DRAFT_498484 [Trematosphaeria pertusa]KAF2255696.1 hypothetical protein BU26DRAFT_498484 [Trematosphaeria pertusa]